MPQDHVSIPKFIEKGFSKEEKVFCYNLELNKTYKTDVSRFGTQRDYYDEHVEKDILANGIEHEFSCLYNAITNTTNVDIIVKEVTNNEKLVSQFFSFMFMRAKQTLADINKNSITSQFLGNLSHSDLIRMQLDMKIDPLTMIGEEYRTIPVINFTSVLFINNSLGFGISVNSNKKFSFFIPLNERIGLLICGKSQCNNDDLYYIHPTDNNGADRLNKVITRTELEYGKWFIFASQEKLIDVYKEYIKSFDK